jgi:hypothetical protein
MFKFGFTELDNGLVRYISHEDDYEVIYYIPKERFDKIMSHEKSTEPCKCNLSYCIGHKMYIDCYHYWLCWGDEPTELKVGQFSNCLCCEYKLTIKDNYIKYKTLINNQIKQDKIPFQAFVENYREECLAEEYEIGGRRYREAVLELN